MICEKISLYAENEKIYYMKYLLDNSPEIEEGRMRPAMIVCPGGGYLVTSDREAEPVAMHYLNQGYQTFVLRYSTASTGGCVYQASLFDLCELMKVIREHAEEWHIDKDKIGIIGFSAGGHLCASLAVHWQDDFIREKFGAESEIFRPNAVILAYPVLDFIYQQSACEKDPGVHNIQLEDGGSLYEHMQKANKALAGDCISKERFKEISPIYYISKKIPPIFIWHTSRDDLVYVGNSLLFAHELEKSGMPFELHIFETGPHGMSLANKNSSHSEGLISEDVNKWTELADRFLKRHFK